MHSSVLALLATCCIAGKFGRELNLAVWQSIFATAKLKLANISYLHNIIRMAIPYWTAKFKSANIFAMVILGPNAKFNSHQYFQLYSIAQLWNLCGTNLCDRRLIRKIKLTHKNMSLYSISVAVSQGQYNYNIIRSAYPPWLTNSKNYGFILVGQAIIVV